MISLTKIFHFETAHAINGYNGACKNIHGHSYELQVTVASVKKNQDYFPTPGFIIDFKEIKNIVKHYIIEKFDHKLIISQQYIVKHPEIVNQPNLLIWEFEPTAENILLFIQKNIHSHLPENVRLVKLKLYETKDSFAEWTITSTL